MKNHNYAILLAGGQGSRFWPQSRTLEPKQFLPLHKDNSLLAETINRIKSLIRPENIFVATCELYRNRIFEFTQPFAIPPGNVIFEPEPKNTAPSIGIAARLISIKDPEAKICIFPCDHMVSNSAKFIKLLNKALDICADKIVIFGITPYRPATGYGYIKFSGSRPLSREKEIYYVNRFLEKPDLKNARLLLKKGYLWNSGIFVGSCRVFLEEIKAKLPSVYKQIAKIKNIDDIKTVWDRIKPISFDFGVLERSRRLLVIKATNLGWSDLGSWQAWDAVLEKDRNGNAFKADTINLDSQNVTVLGDSRLIATIGLEDVIIVDTADALLVTKKDKSEEVKKVVDMLKGKNRQEHYSHKIVRRPWGTYDVLEIGYGYKVKLVEIKPKHSLSVQYHKKRSEHWVVVEGIARIIKKKRSFTLRPNESTYIPAGCLHRLTNPANTPLKIIEVQTGNYLEEDDIIRIKDDFGRP